MATSTARKTTSTPAKKAAAPVAKKTTAAPTARKSASAKPPVKTATTKTASKPTVDQDAEATGDAVEGFLAQVIEFIKQGIFDFGFTSLLDAIEERETAMANMVRESKKTTPKKTATVAKEDKKVPLPTRATTFVPEVGVVYAVSDGPAKGASFKFAGFYKDDDAKAKGEITKTVEGYPVGKKVVLPVNVLRKPSAARRRTAK